MARCCFVIPLVQFQRDDCFSRKRLPPLAFVMKMEEQVSLGNLSTLAISLCTLLVSQFQVWFMDEISDVATLAIGLNHFRIKFINVSQFLYSISNFFLLLLYVVKISSDGFSIGLKITQHHPCLKFSYCFMLWSSLQFKLFYNMKNTIVEKYKDV